MKKFLVMVLATISMVACMNEEITEMPNGGEISFDNAFVENSTRAELNSDNLADFAVWAYAEEPQNVVFAGEEVEKTNGVWGYQGKQYWLPGKTYYFAAVAPYEGNWSDAVVDGGKLESVNFTNDGNVDLLYATANQVGKSANEGNSAVQFTFSHILSKVKFNFMNGLVTNQGNNKIIVKNVTMKVAETATWNGSAWSSLDGEVALNFGSTGDAAIALNDDADTKALFVIPSSDVFDISFDVEVYFGNNSNVAYTKAMNSTVTGIELVKGHAYNFTAVITPETLNLGDIEFDADVEEWIPGGDVTPVVGQSIKTSEALVAAFAQGGEFVLADNFNLTDGQSLVVPAGKTVVLNLNGYSISQVKEQNGKYALIENNGTLEIINSGATSNSRSISGGTIAYGDNATLSGDVGYTSNTIQNNGELTINEGVTIVNNSGASVATYGYPHVIDTNGKLTINGGTLTNNANYSTIRIWTSNDDPEKCKVVINGGTFNGSIDFQAHNNNYATIPHYGTLTINGGNFNADTFTKSAVRVLRFAVNANDMKAELNGGNFDGKVWVRNIGSHTETPQIFTITGGTYATDNYTAEELETLKSYFVEGSVSSTEDGKISIIEGLVCDANGNYHVSSAAALYWVANEVNKVEQYVANIFRGKTVYLDADIDLQGAEWIPIGDFGNTSNQFDGTFDGQNHTVSNFKISKVSDKIDSKNRISYGFFGNVNGTIKNLTISNANINVPFKFIGGLIGRLNGGLVDNCHIKNSSVKGSSWTIGGLVAQVNAGTISNCSVEGTTVTGTGAVGAIAGIQLTTVERTIENCSVKNCDIMQEGSSGASYDKMFGVVLGATYSDSLTLNMNNIEVEGNTIKGEASDLLIGYIEPGNKVYVDGNALVDNAEALAAAIVDNATIMLAEGTYEIPVSAQKKTLKFIGIGNPANTTIHIKTGGSYEGCNYNLRGSKVVFENLTITADKVTYIGYAGCDVTFNNCVINDTVFLYGNTVFANCTFNISGDNYNVWTWTAPTVTFNKCVINSDGKALLLYGGANTKMTINDSVFNDYDGLDTKKAAIEIGSGYGAKYELIVNNTVVNGYAINDAGINTGTTLWGNKNSMSQDELNVIVDGVDVY